MFENRIQEGRLPELILLHFKNNFVIIILYDFQFQCFSLKNLIKYKIPCIFLRIFLV